MLPLQITLEGFMCYLGAQTFDFRDSNLWMLTGRNGAGKSTVFDAMRWALFGVHRGGAQGNNALVHHDAPAMKVEFIFALGEDRVRVTRTQTRGGKSSRQIERDRGQGFEAVPATETDLGFRDWVAHVLGLSDATFCSAMYLGQGRADALLDANPKERYRVLAEVVDLSAFQRLHAAADDKRIEARRAAEAAARADEAAPLIAEEAVIAQSHLAGNARQTRDETAARVAHWESLRPAAAQWQKWDADRQTAQGKCAQLRDLIADAPEVERDLNRLQWLERAISPLEKWRKSVARHADLQTAIAGKTGALESLGQRLNAARDAEDAARECVETERETLDAAREALTSATQIAAELRPQTEQIAQLETARAELHQLEIELARLPADAPAQAQKWAARIEAAESLQSALPHFVIFAQARVGWQQARAALGELERQAPNAATLAQAQNSLGRSQSELLVLEEALVGRRDAATLARAALESARAARARFAEVDGATQCYVCGQSLTAGHAQREAARLEAEASQAERGDADAEAARALALAKAGEAKKGLERSQSEFERLQREQAETTRAREALRRDEANALDNARAAKNSIGERWGIHGGAGDLGGTGDLGLEAALQNEFPRACDIEAWSETVGALPLARKQREQALQQARERADLARRRDELERQSAPLEARFSAARAAAIGEEAARAARKIERASAQIEASRPRLKDAEAALQTAQAERERAQNEREPLASELAGLRGERATATRGLEEHRAEIAPDLQPFLDADTLPDELEKWGAEKARLEGADLRARAENLARARTQIAALETRLGWIDEHIGALPAEARRAVAGVDAELRGARSARDEAAHALEIAARELANLEAARARKIELGAARAAAETSLRRLETLAHLLGPDKLQLYLLQEAQVGIIAQSNAILDRISGGTLRLELRREDQNVQGRARAESALDFVVFHQPRPDQKPDQKTALFDEPRAIYPAFLSGSQRFRVAVALALGIGRYAAGGQGAARLESVMVDEGFGSLDKQGRDEMVGELRNLGRELKRVILVSHQEDFAEAFPNRYLVEHDGRQARARLVSD